MLLCLVFITGEASFLKGNKGGADLGERGDVGGTWEEQREGKLRWDILYEKNKNEQTNKPELPSGFPSREQRAFLELPPSGSGR